MKKITFSLMTACLLLIAQPQQLVASTKVTPTSIVIPQPSESEQAEVLIKRLNQINEMDKSNLTRSEKKELGKEVRSIKHKLRFIGGGIYISVGALILIVILLIIFL